MIKQNEFSIFRKFCILRVNLRAHCFRCINNEIQVPNFKPRASNL